MNESHSPKSVPVGAPSQNVPSGEACTESPCPAGALALAPGSALRAAAARLGVEKLNCKTCCHGFEDTDGEPGATYYCGMTCSKNDMPETYLEDNGLDVNAEKACWEPDFWKSNVPEIDAKIDHTERSMQRALKEWRALVASVMPNAQGEPCEPPSRPVGRSSNDQ